MKSIKCWQSKRRKQWSINIINPKTLVDQNKYNYLDFFWTFISENTIFGILTSGQDDFCFWKQKQYDTFWTIIIYQIYVNNSRYESLRAEKQRRTVTIYRLTTTIGLFFSRRCCHLYAFINDHSKRNKKIYLD